MVASVLIQVGRAPLLTDGFLGFCGGKYPATIIDLDHLESAEKAYNYI